MQEGVSARTAKPVRSVTEQHAKIQCRDRGTICEQKPLNTETELFGRTFAYPFFAGPVGAVKLHYGDKYTDQEYNEILLRGCADNKIAAFTGDGTDYNVMIEATDAIGKLDGQGIPTVKPWDPDTIREKMELY